MVYCLAAFPDYHIIKITAYCLCLLLQQPRRINVNVFLRPERSGQYLPSKFFLTRGDLCKSQRSRSWWRPLHHPSLLLRLFPVELLAGCGQVELENKGDEVVFVSYYDDVGLYCWLGWSSNCIIEAVSTTSWPTITSIFLMELYNW